MSAPATPGTQTSTAPAPRPPEPQRIRGSRRHGIERRSLRILRWVAIIGLLIVTLLPFYYMVLLSLRPIEALLRNPSSLIIPPAEFTLSSYQQVLTSTAAGGQGFGRFIANSALVAVSAVIISLIVAVPGAYAIARLPFFGHRQVNALFLAAYLFPAIVMAIPLFVLFTRVGLRGSLVGLILVYIAQTVPVAIYMLRNYLDTVPVAVEEAGLVDGLTRIGVLRRISLPLVMPSIMATGLFIFMIAWNEFLFALLFLVERRESWTVSLGLSQLSGSAEIPTTVLMAGSVVLTLPILILFFSTERLLTGGLTAGAEKG
ncbi:carbohydrate ABC transporter permease [Arthrobacter zhaoguopingii]|uniref:carbohydrate ABC transporter permease n=1 Tax=Arthrobacter zhaoguopingii TaxID=2681491 RepID=UPI001915F60B|nr:carbohydrate ABC transporter permease [Arthrobacter zhaoguopingii]